MGALSSAEALGAYIAGIRFTELPPAVVEQARACVQEIAGCMLGGHQVAAAAVLVEQAAYMGAPGPCPVPGTGCALTAPAAAFAGAALANALDYDDTVLDVGHPGAATVAAALAVAVEQGCSGRDLLAAVVAGYDTGVRIGRATRPSGERARVVRVGNTWPAFGAAAAAARLYGLDAGACADALGLAALHVPTPNIGRWYERPILAIKNNQGWAAMGGVIAARLAGRGLQGQRGIFDGPKGFHQMIGSDTCDATALTAGLGHEFAVVQTAFKPYPCCRSTHPALDALAGLVREHDLRPGAVRRIHFRGAPKIQVFADYSPHTVYDLQFSLPFLAGLVLLRRDPNRWWAGENPAAAPELQALARLVEIEADPALGHRPDIGGSSVVTVETTAGATLQAPSGVLRGEPANPLTPAERAAKFHALAAPVLGELRARDLAAALQGLEHLPDVRALGPLLQAAAANI